MLRLFASCAFFLALFPVASAFAQNAPLPACPAPQWSFSVAFPDPRISFDADAPSLKRKMTGSSSFTAAPNGSISLFAGVYTHRPQTLSIASQGKTKRLNGGYFLCLSEASFILKDENPHIEMLHTLRENQCAAEAVLAHEMEHHRRGEHAARSALFSARESQRSNPLWLQGFFAPTEQEAHNALRSALNTIGAQTMALIEQTEEPLQRAHDSPEESRRMLGACGGAVERAARKALNLR